MQPPNCATTEQRQAALARQGISERNVGGRIQRFQFTEPTDDRPARLADNVNTHGKFWQEWEYGIGGNKPAKLWTDTERGSNSKYGRRRPIYLILNRSIHLHKRLPSEAFRLLEDHFGNKNFGKIAQEIKTRELNGTLHKDLRDWSNPLPLRHKKKRKASNEPIYDWTPLH